MHDIRNAIRHDFSTSENGVVPVRARRPRWHMTALWTTFAANFSFVFLGVALYSGGYGLAATVGIALLGCSLYIGYALFASYLGSTTGQTHALLTRSIFGGLGSWLVGAFVLVAPLGWVGFNSGLLAQTWDGLYGWGHLELLTVVLAFVMIINNLVGFTGISIYARYIVAPLMILWIAYFIVRAFTFDGSFLHSEPHGGALPFWAAVGSAVGFAMWGNEPDVWRFGKPSFIWPLPSFVFAYFWFVLFVLGGWIMACLSGSSDFGAQVRFMTNYSLFGVLWLAWVVATVGIFAVNDGNYYESINAGQNLVGAWRKWRRPFTCLAVASGGAFAAYYVNFSFIEGWFKVGGFLSITVPSATVIMVVDQLVLPRLFGINRAVTPVPAWREVGFANWPAIAALVVAVVYGAFASSLLPFSATVEDRYWGPVPLECWAIAALLYLALVALARSKARASLHMILGFSHTAIAKAVPELTGGS
jgi:purine-cytosine permease-like protein